MVVFMEECMEGCYGSVMRSVGWGVVRGVGLGTERGVMGV